jgi:hypothetical protein
LLRCCQQLYGHGVSYDWLKEKYDVMRRKITASAEYKQRAADFQQVQKAKRQADAELVASGGAALSMPKTSAMKAAESLRKEHAMTGADSGKEERERRFD